MSSEPDVRVPQIPEGPAGEIVRLLGVVLQLNGEGVPVEKLQRFMKYKMERLFDRIEAEHGSQAVSDAVDGLQAFFDELWGPVWRESLNLDD